MAKAMVTKSAPVFTLEMSEAEARAVFTITGAVSGEADWRVHADAVYDALRRDGGFGRVFNFGGYLQAVDGIREAGYDDF